MIKCVVPIICAKFAFHRQPVFRADLRGCWNGGELASLLTKALLEWLNFAFSEAKWWTMKVSGTFSLEYQRDYPHSPAFSASLDHVNLYICIWFIFVIISRSASRFGWWFCYWLSLSLIWSWYGWFYCLWRQAEGNGFSLINSVFGKTWAWCFTRAAPQVQRSVVICQRSRKF